jgi:glycosyltransferase involved in cell wall biosynthesis
MCGVADKITVASQVMAEIVMHHTGRESTVIDDPYENAELPARCYGEGVLWFGHSANVSSLIPHIDKVRVTAGPSLIVCSNIAKASVPWSRENEDKCLQGCAVVLLTSSNPGASCNRVVKALRAGRFVVAPEDCPEAWGILAPFIHIGDVSEGIRWALNNREEACSKIMAGQKYIAAAFSPEKIAAQWTELFGSI